MVGKVNSIMQGCPILLLDGHCPAELSSNQLQQACLEVSSDSEGLN